MFPGPRDTAIAGLVEVAIIGRGFLELVVFAIEFRGIQLAWW